MNFALIAAVVVFPISVPLIALFGAMLLAGVPIEPSLGVMLSVSILAACGMTIGSLVSDHTGFKGTRRTLQIFGASVVLASLMADGGFWTIVAAACGQAAEPAPQIRNLLHVAISATALLAKTAIILSATAVAVAAPLSLLGRVHFPEFEEALNALIPIGVLAAAVLSISYIIEGIAR
jgi:hypothetical protein